GLRGEDVAHRVVDAARPDQIALVADDADGERILTNAEFAALVAYYARMLIGYGVGPEVAVAVCMPRSAAMVVAIHAILAAGGQYVPVDPAAPADRADYILDTAAAAVVLVSGEIPAAVAGRGTPRVSVDLDVGIPDALGAPLQPGERTGQLTPANAAYTIFTSGSTGNPKGVTVSQASVLNRLRWGLDTFGLTSSDTVILKTPNTFDVSVPELFAPVLGGARMFVAADGGHTDPEYLVDALLRRNVTSVHFVPSMLSVFLDVVDETRLRALTGIRYVFASGEALPPAVARRTRAIWPDAGLHDLFGPTEAAVEVSHADLAIVGRTVPIGHPIWNTATYVLDSRLRPVGDGVPGELYLGGVQIARGYAGRPDLTADRFVADPFGRPGERLYRTGDLVARNRDGELEYLGRTDFQVKLRGQRIELGEIESVLAAVDSVVHAAATVAIAPAGGEHLVAYLAGPAVDLESAKDAVAQALPEYMRPTVWTVLSTVPLNSAGKLDRRSLPEPDFASARTGTEFVAPVGAVEARIAELVAAVLGVEQVGATDSFFSLGGDSIMSIQLSSLLRGAGFALAPRDIFERRTVRGLAAAAASAGAAVLAELPGGAMGDVDITPTIAWMLENSVDAAAFADYSQAMVLTLPARISDADVRTALTAVLARHPILAGALTRDGGSWRMVAGAPSDPRRLLRFRTVESAIGTERFDDELRRAHRDALEALDPAAGVMVAAVAVRTADGSGRLVLTAHHAVVDAVSWRIVVTDLATAAAQLRSGLPVELSESSTSMRRWARVLTDLAATRIAEIPLWRSHLPASPVWGDAPAARVAEVASVVTAVDPAVTEAILRDVAAAYRTGVDDVLLAALMVAVARRHTGTTNLGAQAIAVLIEGHGREESIAPGADLSRSVGWFTSVSPVSVPLDELGAGVSAAVKAVKEALAGRPED
ncbi:amino acid adenylation domain-containing protein, partial [Gordonia sp. NPDC003585]|uniref:amino acid adenylation domain-containing protein n=1 Tax=Gordonia sp. NPDC003585 TaxID=3154275 RepID=UPI0033BF3AE2